LKEQIGAELLPAAAELLGGFNNFVDDIAPAVIGAFGLVGDAITTTAELTDKGTDVFTDFIKRYILGQRVIKDEENAVDDFNKAVKENTEILNENSVQIFGSTGFSQDFFNVIADGRKAYASYTNDIKNNRTQILINTTQTKKYGDEIDKKLNPIFGESNALILSNIQLELERKKILDLITTGNENVAVATAQRNQASKELQELQIQENVADAEAAIRKAELETRIGFLNNAMAQGKDVSLDLALAEAELAEAEFELANESDRLKIARDALTIAENNLENAIKNQDLARAKAREALIGSIDDTDSDTEARNKNAEAIDKQKKALERFNAMLFNPNVVRPIVSQPTFDRDVHFGDPTFPSTGAVNPADVFSNQSNVSTNGSTGNIELTANLVIDDEVLATTTQKVNTRNQQQGKTFLIDRIR